MLARIAPGRGFNFSDGKQPLAMARKSLTEMADLLNLQSAAETHLAHYEDFIRSMKPRFVKRGERPLLLTDAYRSAPYAGFRSKQLVSGNS
ncbi:iron-hydroxamate transporter substrate-binding subunit [Escherichia coli]|uniref:Iron-hydroxamate transporter substrate-binding subunit n=1 Tax=Escherichia coli TaxID=562 RepID=A0A376U3Q2_ECOLX|nr:iron-hydroxamate transporter substrate-binding subunit [Escherichia coli]